MPYKFKNLAVLLSVTTIVVLAGAYLTLWSYPRQIDETRRQLLQTNKAAAQLSGIESEFYILEKQINEKKEKLAGLEKEFITEVTFATTYDYLNSILQHIGFLEFNMNFVRTVDKGDYGYSIFSIRGQGSFQRLYQFIYYLENGPQLYQIDKISLHSVEVKDEKTQQPKLVLPFQMEIRAYYSKFQDLPQIRHNLSRVRPRLAQNPFRPAILKSLPGNVDNLIDARRAELRGIFTNRIMLEYDGKTHILKQGDRVYLGHLSKIDPGRNEAVFTLNKGGIVERVVLKLEFKKNQEGDN